MSTASRAESAESFDGDRTHPHLEAVREAEMALETKPSTYESLTQKGDQRLERAKVAVGQTVSRIGGFFQRTWGKVKGLSAESLKVVLSAPEIAKFGKDKVEEAGIALARTTKSGIQSGMEMAGSAVVAGKDAGLSAYRDTIHGIAGAIESGGLMLKGAKESVMQGAKNKYAALEGKAVGAYEKLQSRITAIRERAAERAQAKEVQQKIAQWRFHKSQMEALEEEFRKIGFVKG